MKTNIILLKLLIWFLGLIPMAYLSYLIYNPTYDVNAFEELTKDSGLISMIFLILTLSVTPLKSILKIPNLILFRKDFGLLSFFYMLYHFYMYFAFEQKFQILETFKEIINNPFILVGFISFLFFVPLALTSNKISVRKLGAKRWNSIHSHIYFATFLAIMHDIFAQKTIFLKPSPFYFFILFIILMFWRVLNKLNQSRKLTETKNHQSQLQKVTFYPRKTDKLK